MSPKAPPTTNIICFHDLNEGKDILYLYLIVKSIYIIFVVYWQEIINLQCEVKSSLYYS